MAFLAEDKKINDLFTRGLLEIPRNQRHYVWTKDNWVDLFSDIIFIINHKEDKKAHFIGSIVLKREEPINGLEQFTIIDGQQRSITMILLLAAIMKLFQEYEMESDFRGTIQYLILKDRKNEEYCVLHSECHLFIQDIIQCIVNYDDKRPLPEILQTKADNKQDKNIAECLLFFHSMLKEFCANSTELILIRDTLLDTNYVRITSDTDEDSYTIFEILNARGQALADHELLKNYIMRYITPKNVVDEVKIKWERLELCLGTTINRFFKHYTTHKTQSSKKGNIYRILQQHYDKDHVRLLMDDILLKAKYYQILNAPTKESCTTPIEYRILHFFKTRKAEQLRPILLSLMHQKENRYLSCKSYEDALKYLYAFYVCYNIISDEKSNKLEDVVYKYAPILENQFSDENLAAFLDSIKRKVPSFSTFTEKLATIGWSNHYEFYKDSKKKEKVKTILELLEQHLSGKIDFEDETLEHILPDSESGKHALIGNIILLERPLNEACKDLPIERKLQFYAKSGYAMTRSFADRYEKQTFDLQTRSKYLAKMLYEDILNLS